MGVSSIIWYENKEKCCLNENISLCEGGWGLVCGAGLLDTCLLLSLSWHLQSLILGVRWHWKPIDTVSGATVHCPGQDYNTLFYNQPQRLQWGPCHVNIIVINQLRTQQREAIQVRIERLCCKMLPSQCRKSLWKT